MNIIKRNIAYIKSINSCDLTTCTEFFRKLVVEDETPEKVEKLFTSKMYLWNILRGKQFYKTMSYFISSIFDDYDAIEEGVKIYEYIVNTASSDDIRKAFTTSVMKKHPFLTLTSIRYSSYNRIADVISTRSWIFVDNYVKPIADYIAEN